MNYMEQVAQILGVKPFEKFKLKIQGQVTKKRYAFSAFGVYECDGDKLENVPEILSLILTGKVEIVKSPWKPKTRDKYYYIGRYGNIESSFWTGDLFDLMLYKLCKLYRTEAEAVAHLAEDNEYWDEIRKELEE